MPPEPDIMDLESPATYEGASDFDSTGFSPPVPVDRSEAVYPEEAQKTGLQGWVAFEFVVGVDGKPEPPTVVVLDASAPVFIEPARDAVLTSLYEPGRKDGLPVRVLVRHSIYFTLR